MVWLYVGLVIIDGYQEQPHLLDHHLGKLEMNYQCIYKWSSASLITGTIVSRLLTMTKQTSPPSLSQQAFRYLYLLSKVRGPKVILRWFSHEVADLEPVLSLLESQDSTDSEVLLKEPQTVLYVLLTGSTELQTWETRYILLLWLSIIVMIPFDLSLLDSSQQSKHETLHRILQLGQHYVLLIDKSRDAAALLLSRQVCV